ncbi:MAG TPA: DUF3830 family protein [Desulfobacteraceae bacterium]|nr:DUF3830 family protein [Desulfobacteraceae bacterium]
MDQLKITIGNEIVRARLLEEEAPNVCKVIKKHCPLQGKLNHAKICDNEVFFQAPFFIEEKENFQLPQAGDIGFWNVRQTICVWYDDMKPLGPTICFARIIDNLKGFQKEARKTWEKQGTKIEFQLIG